MKEGRRLLRDPEKAADGMESSLQLLSMASPCGSMSQRTLAAPDIFYSLPSSTWPGFKHLQSIRNHIFNSCPNGYLAAGGGALGFSGGHGGLERGYGRKNAGGAKMLMSLLLSHALSGWRRRLPSETRNVQRLCRQRHFLRAT